MSVMCHQVTKHKVIFLLNIYQELCCKVAPHLGVHRLKEAVYMLNSSGKNSTALLAFCEIVLDSINKHSLKQK